MFVDRVGDGFRTGGGVDLGVVRRIVVLVAWRVFSGFVFG